MRGVACVALILLTTTLAGCATFPEDADPATDADPSFPPRSNDRTKPVALLHGFNLNILNPSTPQSDPSAWTATQALLAQEGWTGPILTYGYYGCDVGFDRHVSDHGTHEGPGHANEACRPNGHDLDASIEHLAQHFAWAIYDEFGAQWQCIDTVAHSMGGLILRYALHGVEQGLPGFPPELCIEDAITMGTPHNGAGLLGGLCAEFLGYTQCRQMTDYQGFLYTLATSAPTPQGTAQTDWTTIGSRGDSVVYFDSAVAMQSHQKVLFLDSIIAHVGATGYQLAGLDSAHRVRYFDASNGGLVMMQGPAPLAWAVEALELDSYRFAQGIAPPAPQALRSTPPQSEGGVIPGQTVTFEAGCQNAQSTLLGGEWWTRAGEGAWTPEGFDAVQIDTTPWMKSRSFTFDTPGTYGIRFTCLNEFLATSTVEWTIDADAAYNDEPTAQRVAPAQAAGTLNQASLYFEGTCANPNSDLAKAQWQIQAPGAEWALWKEDTVQFHADPWTTSTTITFSQEGDHTVRLLCTDTYGATAQVDWTIRYEKPPGPTAYRYAPTVASGTVEAGQTVEFEAGCSNPNGDLERGEWWTRMGSNPWQMENQDYVQWSSDPWTKTREYTFPDPGSYGIQFRCINSDGGEGSVEWDVTAE